MKDKLNALLKNEIVKLREKKVDADELYEYFKHHYCIYTFPFFETIIDSHFVKSSENKIEIIKLYYERNHNGLVYYCLSQLKQSVDIGIINRYETWLLTYLSRFGIEEIVGIMLSKEFYNIIPTLEVENLESLINIKTNISNIIENSVDKDKYVKQLEEIVLNKELLPSIKTFYCHILNYFNKQKVRETILNFYRKSKETKSNYWAQLILFLRENIEDKYISIYYDLIDTNINRLSQIKNSHQFHTSMLTIIGRHDNSKLVEILKKQKEKMDSEDINCLPWRIQVNIVVYSLIYKVISLDDCYKFMKRIVKVDKTAVQCVFSWYMASYHKKLTKEDKERFLLYFYNILANVDNSVIMDNVHRIILLNSIIYSKYMEDIYASAST